MQECEGGTSIELRRVEIKRFSGTQKLDWLVQGDFLCLVGPGDSTKTTILDAFELALSPRWSVPFDDTAFFGAQSDKPLSITVTVGELPKELKSTTKFGGCARGLSAAVVIHDEPEESDEVVLSIRLRVGASLEPIWTVVNERTPEGERISAEDRERIGCVRLGDSLDRHFTWGRGSPRTLGSPWSSFISGTSRAISLRQLEWTVLVRRAD